MSLEFAENLSHRLGLAHGLLLGRERDAEQRHHALLDGVDGSFSLSAGPIEIERLLDWTWSSQLATHVTIEGDVVTARQVVADARPLVFKRDQVDRKPEAFLSALISKRIEPPVNVVQHVVGCFRSHRHVAASANLTNNEALETFLHIIAQEIRGEHEAEAVLEGNIPDARLRLPAGHDERLRDELRYSRLAGRRAELALTMRHAAGMVFQEAHADLLTEPLQPQLFGLPPVPDRANRTQLGAYYTPPGLARNLADLAITEHLHKPRIKIVDPACGSGIFLCEVLHALERRSYRGEVELIGLDVSASAIAMAKFALNYGGFADRPGVTATVQVGDFLRLADRLDADVVLMNPPFLAMPDMAADIRDRLQQILGDAFRYRPDLSMAFTSLAQHHLREGGTLATLLPAGALSQTGGVKWRDGLLRGNEVELIAVLGEHGLFRDAMVNIAALVLRKNQQPAESAPTMLWASQKRGASSSALRRLRRWSMGNRNPERTIDWSIYPTSQNILAERDDWTPRPYSLGELPERLACTPGIAAVEDLFHVELGVRAGRVPVGMFQRVPDLVVTFQGVDRDDGPLELVEHVVMGWDLVPHPPDCSAVEPRKRDREPGPELLLELAQHGPGRDHQDPIPSTAQSELRGDQARLQGLPEADVIRDQKPNPVLRQRPLHREVLKGQIVNRGPAQRQGTTRRGRCRPERGREVKLRIDQT